MKETYSPKDAHFFIDGIWYKIGYNNHLYFFDNFDWLKSTKNIEYIQKKTQRKFKSYSCKLYFEDYYRENELK